MLMFSTYIMCLTYNLLYCYMFSKYVLKEKFRINKRMLVICGILAIFLSINFYYNKTPLKPFVSHIIEFLSIKLSYNESFIKSLIGLLITFIIISISELLFSLLFINIVGIKIYELNTTVNGVLFGNLQVIIMTLIICNIKQIKNIFVSIITNTTENRGIYLFGLIILSLSAVTFMLYVTAYQNVSSTYLILINLFFISVYVFMIGFFVQKSNNNKLTNKYDQLIDYSKTYEQELVKRSKKQHEYKNQLVIIKSMIEDNDADIIDYINGILHDNDKNKDTKWLTRLTNIPLGGLKGLIYYKINEMISKGIDVNLEVAESLNKKSLWKNYSENSHDISKIIGVYIDNAIEAASSSTSKEVEIQFYLENNNIVLCLGNTFVGNIDLSKIDAEGYSTKGNNRGYGLPLAKDLLSKHSDILESERTIIHNYYVQNLMIKIK